MSKKLDQKGAVSIVSVVIFTTIITVLITAYLRSAVVQRSESLTYDLSNRALYAAESGVQDTIRQLAGDPTLLASNIEKSNCKPMSADVTTGAVELGNDIALDYTCQRYNFEPKSLSGSVKVNKQSAIMKIEPKDVVGPTTAPKLVLRWSEKHEPGSPSQVLYPRTLSVPYLSSVDKWYRDGNNGNNGNPLEPVHAMLRVSVMSTPSTGPISAASTSQRVSFFNPTGSDNDGVVDFTLSNSGDLTTQQENLFNNAKCYESDVDAPASEEMSDGETTYSCKQTIDLSGYDFNNNNVYVRVSSLYRDTEFSVQLLSNGTEVALQNAQVAIDVTGRAGGSTYRRVLQRVSLANYKVVNTTSDGGTSSDAALIAGEGICKHFTVANSPSVYGQGCGSSAP